MSKNYSLYLLDKSGGVKELGSSQKFIPSANQKLDTHWQDFSSLKQIQKVLFLTTKFDLSDLSAVFGAFLNEIDAGLYSFDKFDVRHANVFADYLDLLEQLFNFTKEKAYLDRKTITNDFVDEYFFNRSSPFDQEALEKVRSFLQEIINFLHTQQSN
jgi:hypothetical protein